MANLPCVLPALSKRRENTFVPKEREHGRNPGQDLTMIELQRVALENRQRMCRGHPSARHHRAAHHQRADPLGRLLTRGSVR